MTRCLDEAKLQSYFDGELSIEMMESVTSHLASCVRCAAAAREVEQESALLVEALSAEFEASVPTANLRQRIDEAVLGERVVVAQTTQNASGLAAFFSGLLNFGAQRNLAYASLAVMLAFAAILGVVMMKNTTEPTGDAEVAKTQPDAGPGKDAGSSGSAGSGLGTVAQVPAASSGTADAPKVEVPKRNRDAVTPRPSQVVPASTKAPVKLLPGERSYLQTIARLDSTIKSNKKEMRPSLRVEYEHNLAVVDRAIAATRSAAKSNPTDPDAADFMFAAYQSKVDLLNTIADARLGGRGH